MSKPLFWTDDRVASLTKWLAEGVTYQEIGDRLGCGKSAAIGKAHRLGIAEGAVNAAGSTRQPSTIFVRLDALDVFPPTGRCVYPIGHPRTEGFHFCGDRVTDIGAPYCADHNRKCWQGAGSVKQREAWENDPERRLKAAAHARKIAAAKQRGAA